MSDQQQKPKLLMYIDIPSAFTYLTLHVLLNSKLPEKVEIDFVPVSIFELFRLTENVLPLNIPNKGAYLSHDFRRQVLNFSVPLAAGFPPGFGKPDTLALLSLIVIKRDFPTRYSATIAAFFEAFWVDHKSVGEVEVVKGILGSLFEKEEVERIVDVASKEPVVEETLEKNIEKALEDGAFGLPYMLATNAAGETDKFWGFDHFGQVVDFLGVARSDGGESLEKKGWRGML